MATYFLALNSANSAKTGKPFYTCTLLTQNQYGRWSASDLFITEKVYAGIAKQAIPEGYPVLCRFAGSGILKGISPDDSVAPLELVPDDD